MRGFQPQQDRRPQAQARDEGGGLSKDAVMAAIERQREPQVQAQNRDGIGGLATDFLRNPRGILRERERKAMGYADGGMVRGPGTGTSDDVPQEVRAGTYIMPADSTRAVGADQLANMGGLGFRPGADRPVPVNLSNGEFKLPPEQVHAVGVQALEQMKNATHAPAARGFHPGARQGQAQGPRTFFADGGLVEDEKKRANSFGDAAAATNNPGLTVVDNPASNATRFASVPGTIGQQPGRQPQAAAPQAAPLATPAVSAGMPIRNPGPSELYMNDRTQEMREQIGAGNYAQAVGTAARTAVQGLGMYGIEAADKLATPVINAAKDFGAGLLGSDAQAATPAPAARPVVAASTPAVTNQTDARLSNGTQTAPTRTPSPAPAPAPTPDAAAPNQLMPGVYSHGKGQYSDQAGGMGLSSSFTGQPNAQNMQAAESLARGFRPGMDAAAVSQGPGLGFSPSGVTAPTVLHSGNSWQARNDLRNLAVSASSITNRPEWQSGSATSITGSTRGKTGKDDPHGNIAAYQTALGADIAARGAQPGFDMQAARENAATMREGMQQQGANQRAGMQEAGANQRADLGFKTAQQRAAIDGRRADSEITALGFKNREAQQYEQLRNVLLDPNATPEQKRQAQQARQLLSGQSDSWKAVALQGGTDAMGNKTESVLGAVNERTGEMKRMEGQGGVKAPHVGAVESGYRFKGGDPANPASWEKA